MIQLFSSLVLVMQGSSFQSVCGGAVRNDHNNLILAVHVSKSQTHHNIVERYKDTHYRAAVEKIKGLAISNRGNDMNLDQGFLWHSIQDKNIINKISSSNIEYQVQNKMSTSFEVQQNIICAS